LTGPYSTSVGIALGSAITITLNQLTAGPISNVNVSFGDGTVSQFINLTSSSVNITKNYTTAGTFTITATPSSQHLPVTVSNTITVNVISPALYKSKFYF
jgi:PKD repeat protein